jgi:hypothetical protein
MPFDKPHLFPDCRSDRADDVNLAAHDCSSDDDLGLSAELQLLGAQLRGEADLLANRYAPTAEIQPAKPAYSRFRRRMLWQAAAVAVAGLAILVWQFGRPWRASTRLSEVVSAPHDGVSPIVAGGIADTASVNPASAKSRTAVSDSSEFRRTQGIAEVGIDAPATDRHPPANQLEMLRLQLSGFEKVIRKLQTELSARDAAQLESERQIESLQAEVADLRKQLTEKQKEQHARQ